MLWFVTIILLILGALPCFLLGYFIGVKKQAHLISGYDPDKIEDPNGFAVWIGKICSWIGALITLIALGIVVFPNHGRYITLGATFIIMIISFIGLVGARNYFKKPDSKDLPL